MIAAMGWLGSGLVVASVVQRDLRRLRQLNLAASAALGVFNVVLGIWSMIVLNVVLAAVNGYHLYISRYRSAATDTATRIDDYGRLAAHGLHRPVSLEMSNAMVERNRVASGAHPSFPGRM